MPLTFWAPVPLKLTVFGTKELTSRMPAVMVKRLAMPRVVPAVSCNDVPLMVALYRLAMPLREELPVKVAVPAVAVKLPLTFSAEVMVKLLAVVIPPLACKILRLMVPAPVMAPVALLIVSGPPDVVKEPLTDRLPVRVSEAAVDTEPLTLRLFRDMPVPLIVVPVPVIVRVFPELWLKEPEPVVARLPDMVIAALVKRTEAAATVRLLKFCEPGPPTVDPAPAKTMVPVLPLKTPLSVQLPSMEWV